ncbi:DUF2397 family protein [Pseudomonas aeruginosa]|uniref:DUF2397 family protein n=1 Tax=Pseudomonas aeruginosa TaxID=287 RepID=UPI001A94FC2D|nr:DUF2397 family protein [Pseudomonas aeruginosa]MBO0970570.1 DUF2397 family protein [Pseudomonas aeruginosa]MCV4098667.1 DUF2397 family protein [Pseudomonas aeruginosa]MDP5867946.1 DUF2397 family protein [Pseudomonas aeruginosa]MDY1072085.1 DUF2397 family protein [Pseudomonas aeruginosa]MDY1181704.1 DUF2397 family protein [Pseudomonas aeruginosa]
MFRHATAEKAPLYRAIMEVFAAAKRQYRLQLRPDEVLSEANWGNRTPPAQEEIAAALAQLAAWGNLESQPDMTRVSTLNDYYRARFLYRLSRGGEAVEAGLIAFAQSLRHRAELQTVALEDIDSRLQALQRLMGADSAPLVCTDGMPAAAQRILLDQLAAAGARLHYHGDYDWPGIVIGNHVMRTWQAVPWRFGCRDYLEAMMVAQTRPRDLALNGVEALWDKALHTAMDTQGLAIPEEAVASTLLDDLSHGEK